VLKSSVSLSLADRQTKITLISDQSDTRKKQGIDNHATGIALSEPRHCEYHSKTEPTDHPIVSLDPTAKRIHQRDRSEIGSTISWPWLVFIFNPSIQELTEPQQTIGF